MRREQMERERRDQKRGENGNQPRTAGPRQGVPFSITSRLPCRRRPRSSSSSIVHESDSRCAGRNMMFLEYQQ